MVRCVSALLAVLSSLMWGASDFLGGATSRRLPPLAVFGWSQAFGCAVLVVIATASGSWSVDPGYWPWAIGASLSGFAGMLLFYSALAQGPMGIVSPLVSMSVIVPLAFGLLSGESPTSVQVLGIVAAVCGILLASGPELGGAESARPLVMAAMAAVAFGLFVIFIDGGSRISPLMTVTAARITTAVILGGCLAVLRTSGGVVRRDLGVLALLGVLEVGANLLFATAITMGMLATTSVLGSLYPVVTAVLAAAFLHERLRIVQYLGVAATVLGVVLIATF